MKQHINNTWHVQSLEKDFYLGTLGSFDHDFTPLCNRVGGVFSQKISVQYLICLGFYFYFLLKLPSYTYVFSHWCVGNTFILILPTFIIVCNTLIMLNIIFISIPRVQCSCNTFIVIHPKFNNFVPYPYHVDIDYISNPKGLVCK